MPKEESTTAYVKDSKSTGQERCNVLKQTARKYAKQCEEDEFITVPNYHKCLQLPEESNHSVSSGKKICIHIS